MSLDLVLEESLCVPSSVFSIWIKICRLYIKWCKWYPLNTKEVCLVHASHDWCIQHERDEYSYKHCASKQVLESVSLTVFPSTAIAPAFHNFYISASKEALSILKVFLRTDLNVRFSKLSDLRIFFISSL